MRVYLDEDVASHELTARLVAAGHEVLAPLRGRPDARCWRHAQEQRAAVLTINAIDFARLAEATPAHAGLLLLYRENDPTRDLRAEAVAAAIGRIGETYPGGVAGMILVVNQFRW
jgi:hypothetical protein